MIGSIKGKIILIKEKFIIVEKNGIGYKISIPSGVLENVIKNKDEIHFWTHLHIKEDAQDLYGFLEYDELEFFELLIGVSGIGPKGALTILSVAPIEILKRAIGSGDISYLTKISGIGRKTAEKMVIELRDKMGKMNENDSLSQEVDILEALKSLGYSQNEARDALKKISGEMDLNTKIKEALKILGKK